MLNAHTPVSTMCDTRVTTHLALRDKGEHRERRTWFSVNGRHQNLKLRGHILARAIVVIKGLAFVNKRCMTTNAKKLLRGDKRVNYIKKRITSRCKIRKISQGRYAETTLWSRKSNRKSET